MVFKKSLTAVVSVLCLLLGSSSAFACACCVDQGFYQISTLKPAAYDIDMLGGMKFDKISWLYTTNAGFDAIRGLDDLKKDDADGKPVDLSVEETFTGKTWRLRVISGEREGSLVLPMPKQMVKFKVDQHDNAPQTEPSLYKELRFKGVVGSGTGFFKRGIVKSTSYFLVFQGRGNGCDGSADFTHWRLEIEGPKAEYAFFGKLKP